MGADTIVSMRVIGMGMGRDLQWYELQDFRNTDWVGRLTCRRSSYACFKSNPPLSVIAGGFGRTSVAIKEINRAR
jgi:hypothetical protein